MSDATAPVRLWQRLLTPFGFALPRPGYARFARWVTGTALGWGEHTIPQAHAGVGLGDRGRVAGHFAGSGAFRRDAAGRQTRRRIEAEAAPRFGGPRVVAADDAQCHRTSKRVWGVCAFPEPAGRSPNRASTARAHDGAAAGDPVAGTPRTSLPRAPRLYPRATHLPAGEAFATKAAGAAALPRQADADSPAPVPAAFGGAYANTAVVGPGLDPANGRRIDAATRLRFGARRYRPLDPGRVRRAGRPRGWGGRLPAPEHHDRGDVPWQDGAAYLDGRPRTFRVKELVGRWSATGPTEPVRVLAAEVEAYADPWLRVTTPAPLTAAGVVGVSAARSRQEDGSRGHEPRLGVGACRARTEAPVERAFAARVVTQALRRLPGRRLDRASGADGRWSPPAWDRHRSHPPRLDVRRAVWASRAEFSDFPRLDGREKCPEPAGITAEDG